MQQMTYAEADAAFIGLIKTKAATWSRRGAGPFDDLVQEGRIALCKALDVHDPKQGPMIKLLGMCLDNRYRTLRAAALAQVRMPYIWEHDLVADTWERVPARPTPLSAYAIEDGDPLDILLSTHAGAQEALSTGQDGGDPAAEQEAKVALSKWRQTLEHRLTDRQRTVLDCYARPSSSLLVLARNITGEAHPEVTIPHIAAYLGVTKNQVDYALHGIRKVAEALFIETEPQAVELIKDALCRRAP